ncbi:YdcH family protein [Undibacterium luofuense]|uniref:YdcH family protein n=1 Tax=Undibacterium luofuense TaxID=2828733 RepID=A0A941DLW9_9BURK|nr:YdcH family protein [Undibacterium luofuense]MBR7782370.1 YdcH family protein [Undibacterium luofuense]
MQVEHHPLAAEFPEHKDAIHHLKMNNAHFAKLFGEYDDTDKAIVRAETGVDHLGDADLENLKKVRISLKDQLFHILQTAGNA